MPDAQAHPQPHVQSKKAHELVTTGSPHIPAFPARLVLTVSFVLSPVIGRFVTVAPEKRQLLMGVTPASRHQNHTTSPSGLIAFVWRNKPSIASRSPTSVTIAKRPSYRARDARRNAGDLRMRSTVWDRDQLARRANQSRHARQRQVTSKCRAHRHFLRQTQSACARERKGRSNPESFLRNDWIASRSLSSGARSRDPLARNDSDAAIASHLTHFLQLCVICPSC